MIARPRRTADAGAMGFVVTVWGLNYLFVREGLTLAPPIWLAAFRAGLGAIVLVPVLLMSGRYSGVSRIDVRDALAIGIPNTAAFFGLWFLAAGAVLPGETAVLVYTFPLFVTLLAPLILGTRATRNQLLAVAGGFGGVVLVCQPWVGGSAAVAPLPVLALLLAALSWALGTVLFKRRFSGRAVLAANSVQLVGGAAGLLVAAVLVEGPALPAPSVPLLATVVWLGVLGTAVAYAIWFALLDRTPATTLSAYTFLVPLVALLASAILLGERIDLTQSVGILVVILALIVNSRVGPTASGLPDPKGSSAD